LGFVIEWHPSPNFSSREGRTPIAIVDHITAGAFPGCQDWLCDPAAQASAGYIVTKIGRIIQLVKDGAKAWHAGVVNKPSWVLYDGSNPNLYTIGIEHEGQPGDTLTPIQYQATLWLHQQLIKQWGIPVDTDHIIGHYRIDSVDRANCPGSGFPWTQLFKDLKGGSVVATPVVTAPVVDPDLYVMVKVRTSKLPALQAACASMEVACNVIQLP